MLYNLCKPQRVEGMSEQKPQGKRSGCTKFLKCGLSFSGGNGIAAASGRKAGTEAPHWPLNMATGYTQAGVEDIITGMELEPLFMDTL